MGDPWEVAEEHFYPWNTIEMVPDSPVRLPLVGYGSLMNRSSALRTLSEQSVSSARPVLVMGARRVYEYVMSPRGRKIYGDQVAEERFGVLNARASEDSNEWFNGIQYQLNATDIMALADRESAYDLVPAWTIPWGVKNSAPQIGYFLSCRTETHEGRQLLDSQLLPHPNYHAICEEGCRDVSSDFLKAFRRSTWVREARVSDVAETLARDATTPPPASQL
ncbi:hypothetical protein Poly24_07730 [Rosistilla carotiformis]|uniref:Gamma-glutamylcyclotransferase AIG2-like domain-containing protein n=1 Tax=Rosistilla carotiformis TaxID=2528017 RepID=A0A518JNF1_9BACT|nr:hypothetical protein [Rosistilla carotiformis]QDV67082.1 hypothetical protein Poly24_07730 [Rosistilla carotiformis]